MDLFRGFLGLGDKYKRDQRIEREEEEEESEREDGGHFALLHPPGGQQHGYDIFTGNPLEMHKMFEKQMDEMMKNFGFGFGFFRGLGKKIKYTKEE